MTSPTLTETPGGILSSIRSAAAFAASRVRNTPRTRLIGDPVNSGPMGVPVTSSLVERFSVTFQSLRFSKGLPF